MSFESILTTVLSIRRASIPPLNGRDFPLVQIKIKNNIDIKLLQLLIACFIGFIAISAKAKEPELLSATSETVYVVSSFDTEDYFTTYSRDGTMLWEINYSAKILSWKIDQGSLFIFSKQRNGQACFLSCFDPANGENKWEKPIYSSEMLTPQNPAVLQ